MNWIDLNLIPSDKPIIIHASYRTGSTALCDYLATNLNRQNFDEALHQTLFPERKKKFLEYSAHNSDYVWKFMPDQLTIHNRFKIHELYCQSFRIKLFRENMYEQITSWVISYTTNKWHVTKGHGLKSYTVPNFSDSWLDKNVHRIYYNNKKLHEFMPDHETDMCLKYEDIKNELSSRYVPRPKPTNFDQVHERVIKAVNKKLGVENV